MMPVRISGRSLGPLRNDAATVTCCRYYGSTWHCQLPSTTGNQAEYVRNRRQAYAAQMVATEVQHAPTAAGGTVRYRSLLWRQNQRPSQLTIQIR
jgi:hypothetical protein